MSYVDAPATRLVASACACCARPLVDSVSVETGVGPDCREKHGFDDATGPADVAGVTAVLGELPPRAITAWEAGDARGAANALVHAIAVEQAGRSVLAYTRALHSLGFARLAARIATRVGQGAITITRRGNALAVVAPYSDRATGAWRAVPGRRWDGAANVVPCASEAALRRLLADHFPAAAVSLDGAPVGLGSALAPLCEAPAPEARQTPPPRPAGRAIPNRYPGACAACGTSVTPGAGRAYPTADRRWATCCAASTCLVACGIAPPPSEPPPSGPRAIAPEASLASPTAGSDAARARAERAGLYAYQADGAAWLAGRPRALLADDMGLGKTAQVLCALPERARAIVVCPSSLKLVWRDECARWRPDLTVRVCAGRGSLVAPREGEIVVINYDVVAESDAPKAAGAIVVFDEAHALKNPKAARTKACRALASAAAASWILTGTPMLGHPGDLWGVLGCGGLNFEAYDSWGDFVRIFGGYQDRWRGWHWAPTPKPEGAARLARVMLRRTKAQVLPQLPAIRERVITHGGLSAALRAEMDEIEREMYDAFDRDRDALPRFERMSRVRGMLASERVPVVLDIVEQYEESGEPLLVFSAHRAPVDALRSREGWAVITGDESGEERADVVRRFQAGELRGVGLTIRAGGVGLTLTRASHVLLVDQEWTPALNAQAIDRVRRIGQTAESILVTRLVSDHALDRRVDEVLARKRILVEATVQAAA